MLKEVIHFALRQIGVPEYLVMDVLTEVVRDGSLMELLYADDLLWCGESLNEVMDKHGRSKNALEGKGLRVNVD